MTAERRAANLLAALPQLDGRREAVLVALVEWLEDVQDCLCGDKTRKAKLARLDRCRNVLHQRLDAIEQAGRAST